MTSVEEYTLATQVASRFDSSRMECSPCFFGRGTQRGAGLFPPLEAHPRPSRGQARERQSLSHKFCRGAKRFYLRLIRRRTWIRLGSGERRKWLDLGTDCAGADFHSAAPAITNAPRKGIAYQTRGCAVRACTNPADYRVAGRVTECVDLAIHEWKTAGAWRAPEARNCGAEVLGPYRWRGALAGRPAQLQ